MHVPLSKNFGAVISSHGDVKLPVREHLLHDAEVIEYFEASWLEALALRSDKVRRSFVDDAELYATAGKIAGQCQASRPSANNQHLDFFVRHIY